MAQEIINVGITANDGLGDPIRQAYIKCNDNFNQLFARAQPNPPATLIGTVGDVAGMYAYDTNYFYYCFADYDGSSTIWAEVTQVGNITLPAITRGTSSVEIVAIDGNIAVNVDGTGNVVVFTSAGAEVTGTVSVSGNITGGNINTTGTISTSGTVASTTLNASAINAGTVSLSGNVISALNVNSNITGANIITAGQVSAAGNVAGTFFIGNGAFLTGIVGGGGGGGGGSFIANGLSRVNIPASSGNVQVDVGLVGEVALFTDSGLILSGSLQSGNVNAGNVNATGAISVSGNVTPGNVFTSGRVSATGNITGGNIITTGTVTTIGNVEAQYFVGNGAFLTGIAGGGVYGNADVANYLPTYTGNLNPGNISASGAISATGAITTANNITVGGTANVTGNINASGNVNADTVGVHTGLVYSIDIRDLSWDFGFIAANTYTNPIQFLLNNAGNIDMGTVTVPTALNIDIGTLS